MLKPWLIGVRKDGSLNFQLAALAGRRAAVSALPKFLMQRDGGASLIAVALLNHSLRILVLFTLISQRR